MNRLLYLPQDRPGRLLGILLVLAVITLFVPGSAVAQESAIADGCELAAPSTQPPAGDFNCAAIARSVLFAQPRLLLAAAGGNPVPGTASTLGMRMGSSPRWSVSFRVAGARLRALSGAEPSFEGTDASTAAGLGTAVAVGLFQGVSLAPTVGGVGSLDALGSVGFVLPGGEFDRGRVGGEEGSTHPFTWSLGLRAGIFRESFTLPGISLTGTYRSVGRVAYQSENAPDDIAWSADLSALGARAIASKQMFGLGLAAGAGVDRISGDVQILRPFHSGGLNVHIDNLQQDRLLAFGSLMYTRVVLHGVVEVGWQDAHDGDIPYMFPESQNEGGDGGFFGSFALRLSI